MGTGAASEEPSGSLSGTALAKAALADVEPTLSKEDEGGEGVSRRALTNVDKECWLTLPLPNSVRLGRQRQEVRA